MVCAEEFRTVIGRHHDSCGGAEIDLLVIVHIACRLATSLGFGVISNSTDSPIAVLNEIPSRAAALIRATPDELTALIEERISEVT